jgi:serine/threonine protein kinase
VFRPIAAGERVAVKCHAFGFDCVGSVSGGARPANYPTKFSTGVRERVVGARLAEEDEHNLVGLLASWVDECGIWLIYRLVPDARELHEILAPESASRERFCARPVRDMAVLFQQFASALQCLSIRGVVHRDGGLENWLVCGADTPNPRVVLIDFGLAVLPQNALAAPDSASAVLGYLRDNEPGLPSDAHEPAAARRILQKEAFDMCRVNPIDWCYAPGAAGPKFPPPPELRVVKEELPVSACEALDAVTKAGGQPCSSGYDVWCLGWTFLQIILGERWVDWKTKGNTDSRDPLAEMARAFFFDKSLQVQTQ